MSKEGLVQDIGDKSASVSKVREFYTKYARVTTIFILSLVLCIGGTLIAKFNADIGIKNLTVIIAKKKIETERSLLYSEFKSNLQLKRAEQTKGNRDIEYNIAINKYDDAFFEDIFCMLDDNIEPSEIADFIFNRVFGQYEAELLEANLQNLQQQDYIGIDDIDKQDLLRGKCVFGIKFSISLASFAGAVWGLAAQLAVLTSGIFTTGGIIGTIVGFVTGAAVGVVVEKILTEAMEKFGYNNSTVRFFEHHFIDTNIWLISFNIVVNISSILLKLAGKL